jgi:hypothetical protein
MTSGIRLKYLIHTVAVMVIPSRRPQRVRACRAVDMDDDIPSPLTHAVAKQTPPP